MKILEQTKGKTKILLEGNEAFMAFTPEGIQTSMPPQLAPSSSKPNEDEVKKVMDWIDDNNPYLLTFMEVMADLANSDHFNDPKFKTRRDTLGEN